MFHTIFFKLNLMKVLIDTFTKVKGLNSYNY